MPCDFSKLFRLNFDLENTRLLMEFYKGFFGPIEDNSKPHSHKFFEVHHILSGNMRLFYGNGEITVSQGETYIVAPNVLHYISKVAESDSVKCSFCFSFSKLNKKTDLDIYEVFCKAFNGVTEIRKIKDTENHKFFINNMFALFNSQNTLDRLKFKMYYTSLITDMARSLLPSGCPAAPKPNEYPEYDIRHFIAEEFIQSRYGENITVSDLAETLHLSEKQTARIFRRNFGRNFQEYLIAVRLASAKSMLANAKTPLTDIAAAVGYGTYTGFYNMFVKQTGITPQEYRKKAIQKTKPE